MMTSTRAIPANFVGDWYQGRDPASGSTRDSLGVSEYTSPSSSFGSRGLVIKVTMMLTVMSTMKAAVAAAKLAP